MPVNLNAFLRYKTIDACLRNKFSLCDIHFLIEKCSEALSNKLGEETSVSERTIREDIRVLRSDILGFEAPIICKDGNYSYADSDYSIFNTTIADKELLIDIQNFLSEEFERIGNKKVISMIRSLSQITGQKIPEKYGLKNDHIYEKKIFTNKELTEDEKFESKLKNYLFKLQINRKKLQKKSFVDYFKKSQTSASELYKWEFILESI